MAWLLPTSINLKTTIDALVRVGTISRYLELEGDIDFALKVKQAVADLLQNKAPAK